MAPEQIGNTNMWKLLAEEYVEDAKSKIEGPAIVRVHYMAEENILVQGPSGNVYAKAEKFESVVKKKVNP